MERLSKITLVACSLAACAPADEPCGPSQAVVTRVIDGDTVDLDTGERVRYLLIDTPETDDCYFSEALSRNKELVEGKMVTLQYDDAQCTDKFGRLLALVSVGEIDVNASLVDDGFACRLYIPPAGMSRSEEFLSRQATARSEGKGMWSQCPSVECN